MLESSTPIGASAAMDPADGAPGHGKSAATGLRERKKQQTRTRIIEVALDLCEAKGFDATTVEQIAHAADVSPRTINRYFTSKEDMILGPVTDFGQELAAALRRLPPSDNQLESLCEAFLVTVDVAMIGGRPVPFSRFQQMQRIMRDAPSVSAHSQEYTESKNAAIAAVLAERLDTTPDALAVRLVLSTWQSIGHIGMDCSGDQLFNSDLPTAARACRDALTTAYNEFVRICGGARPVETM